jgi:hypothetical protein
MVSAPVMSQLVSSTAPVQLQGRYFGVHQLGRNPATAKRPALLTSLLARGPGWL